jgi:nicotinate-nucleotide--dimethylbenzimidazole phosphoribosyltransferase
MISASAALLAQAFCPVVTDYLLASHMGKEPVCHHAMERLGLHPPIMAELALGEGTGAVMLFPMLVMAHAVYHENPSFDDIHIEAYEKFE